MIERQTSVGQAIEWELLEEGLHERNLDGMIPVVALAIALRRTGTIDQLLQVLGEKNAYGNFELRTPDTSLFHRIMGNSPQDLYPTLCVEVASAEAMQKTLKAIREIRQEIIEDTRRQLFSILSADQSETGGAAAVLSNPIAEQEVVQPETLAA